MWRADRSDCKESHPQTSPFVQEINERKILQGDWLRWGLQSGILFLMVSGEMWHPEEGKAELLNGPGSREEGRMPLPASFPHPHSIRTTASRSQCCGCCWWVLPQDACSQRCLWLIQELSLTMGCWIVRYWTGNIQAPGNGETVRVFDYPASGDNHLVWVFYWNLWGLLMYFCSTENTLGSIISPDLLGRSFCFFHYILMHFLLVFLPLPVQSMIQEFCWGVLSMEGSVIWWFKLWMRNFSSHVFRNLGQG